MVLQTRCFLDNVDKTRNLLGVTCLKNSGAKRLLTIQVGLAEFLICRTSAQNRLSKQLVNG